MKNNNAAFVLIVDDVDTNRFVLKDIVHDMGYQPILTENGAQALRIVDKFDISLIISDIAMPVMDGYELCERLKADHATREIPIIFISAFDNPNDVIKGFELGGADYITKPFIPKVVEARVGIHMKMAESGREVTDMNRKLQSLIMEQRYQIEREKGAILYALIRVARENAAYDERHMERLSENSRILAEALQLSADFEETVTESFIETIGRAAPLCDLGNVAIPTDVLRKKGELTDEEWELIKSHTVVGARILADIEDGTDENSFVTMSAKIARSHHENWDGTGYPDGLTHEQIPLSAQIVAVASNYSALTENRAYRVSFTPDEAMDIMSKDSGVKYNPKIFEVLQKIRRQLR